MSNVDPASGAVPQGTDLFLGLTPERVLHAVEAAGLACRPLCYPLNSFENRVYEVELEDGSRVVAKFYRPGRWSREQILEEHAFLQELVDDELSVCAVRPFPDGSTLQRIDGIWYSISDRRGGRAPDELDDGLVARLGMLVARLHNVGARGPAPSRPRLDSEHYVQRALHWIDEEGSLRGPLEARYRAAAGALAELADEVMDGVPTHRIHADLHLGNVLLRDGELRLLDFDDFVTGPAVQDMWLVLPGRGAEALRQQEIFIEAYERFRPFDRQTLRLVEPLRGLRMVRYAGWLARRWHDPAFKAGWPHFGGEEFWLGETTDLEEQLREAQRAVDSALRQGEGTTGLGTALSPQPEELLDNKDYFWDWEDS